ncbi:hypothetical protein [Candidatus Albibeggiatoa sp. nov. BB20]|uniref:hypothetical protein n=1 Tax=Candidatus Albibeggiatoa sp. nov. BB20 TaxID=3162723 RepID=UPI0033658A09
MLIKNTVSSYLYIMSLCLLSSATIAQTVIYPSNLYPDVSWEIQPPAAKTNESMYQYRRDEALQAKKTTHPQQWAAPNLNQPRYRPLNAREAMKSVHSYQYRSEIPNGVLEQANDFSEFKQGLLEENAHNMPQASSDYQNNSNQFTSNPSHYQPQQGSEFKQGLSAHEDNVNDMRPASSHYQDGFSQFTSNSSHYRSQQGSEFKQGLADYQPKPLPHYDYSNVQHHSTGYPTQTYTQSTYPQANRYPTMDNYYAEQQPSHNPWNPQPQQTNPWQTSQSAYQNMMQTLPELPDINLGLPTLPDGQFYFQQNSPYNTHDNYTKQSRELPFSPEQVFIVPSNWIKPPTSSQSNKKAGNNAQFTVYPVEQIPLTKQEIW